MEGKIKKAYEFARKVHEGTNRKGKKVPYIVHPKKVYSLLEKCTQDIDLLCAALLHDVLEDTDTTPYQLKKEFGVKITEFVKMVSEPLKHKNESKEERKKSWLSRKKHTIKIMKTANRKIKLLSCSDKLANLLDMHDDLKKGKGNLWKRFNAPRGKVKWYYEEMSHSFRLGDSIEDTALFKRFYKECFYVFDDFLELSKKDGKKLVELWCKAKVLK